MQPQDADPRTDLQARLARGQACVAGVLSGTSADGIDVAIARFSGAQEAAEPLPPELLTFATCPFPAELGRRLRAVLDGAPCGLRETALLHRDLGRAFGEAVCTVANETSLAVDLIGSHGQTVWHHDGREPSGAATLQLGDGDEVAVRAGAWVVSDFRARDVAAGEGAPLSALADVELFGHLPRPALVLNLGGMANVTWLGEPGTEPLAFDTGPAGSLLDGLARRTLDRPFDEGGRRAAAGRSSRLVVEALLEHPFLAAPPPKSTGRDTFGERWVDGFVERAAAAGVERTEDLLATAVDFVAACVADGVARFLPAAPAALVVAGGGLRNASLVDALGHRTGRAVVSSARFGVDPDAREALVFAALARRAFLGRPSTLASVTGAANGHVLGKLSAPGS